jgi:hypothetical protein
MIPRFTLSHQPKNGTQRVVTDAADGSNHLQVFMNGSRLKKQKNAKYRAYLGRLFYSSSASSSASSSISSTGVAVAM